MRKGFVKTMKLVEMVLENDFMRMHIYITKNRYVRMSKIP